MNIFALSLLVFVGISLTSVFGQPDTWSIFPSSNQARIGTTASAFGSKVYVIGGLGQDAGLALDSVEIFDTTHNTWNFTTPLPLGLQSASSSAFNNYIYVVGGFASNWIPSNRVFRLNPNLQKWDELAPMNIARGALTTAWLNNQLYAIGGSNLTNSLSVNEVYNPLSNTWQFKPAMKIGAQEYERDHLVSGSIDGKIYVIGGRNPYNLALNMEYNPISESWALKTPMPTNRSDSASVIYSGSIFVFGGEGSIVFNNTEEYVVGLDVWKCRAKMPEGKHGLSTAVIGNYIFAMNGGTSSDLSISADNWAYSPPLVNSTGTCPPPSDGASSLSAGFLALFLLLVL